MLVKRLAFTLCAALFIVADVMSAPKSEPGKPAHHTKDGFRNPHLKIIRRSPFAYWRMRLFGDQPFADNAANVHKVPVVKKIADLKKPTRSVHITWLGHATFLIRNGGINILTDPHLSARASPFSFMGPKRLAAKPVRLKDLPKIDYVLISHNHYDHLDADTIARLGDGPQYLVPLKLKPWFIANGISADRVHEFDWWDKRAFGALEVTATPLQHWSARGMFDRYETLWAGWHVAIGGFSFWFAGDTGYYAKLFRQIGKRFGGVDLGLIPIGGYAPRWFMKRHHVNPAEAVMIHKDIRARLSVGTHWGTFQLTAEPIDEPKRLLEEEIKARKIKPGAFITMAIGETRVLNGKQVR